MEGGSSISVRQDARWTVNRSKGKHYLVCTGCGRQKECGQRTNQSEYRDSEVEREKAMDGTVKRSGTGESMTLFDVRVSVSRPSQKNSKWITQIQTQARSELQAEDFAVLGSRDQCRNTVGPRYDTRNQLRVLEARSGKILSADVDGTNINGQGQRRGRGQPSGIEVSPCYSRVWEESLELDDGGTSVMGTCRAVIVTRHGNSRAGDKACSTAPVTFRLITTEYGVVW